MQLSFPQPPRSSAVNPLEKLMPDSHVDTISEYSPVFVNIDNTTLATGHSHSAQMKNGLKVNIVRSTATSDSNDVSIRLQVNPLDSSSDDRILTELGTRLLQEGGSLWNHSKSQIELFCTDNDVTVSVKLAVGFTVLNPTPIVVESIHPEVVLVATSLYDP